MVFGTKQLLKLVKEKKLIENLDQRELTNPEGTGFDLRVEKLFIPKGETFLGITHRQTAELKEVNPYLATLLFMIDQYTWSRDIASRYLNKGGVIISNRYFSSNVHNIAKLYGKARSKFRDWIWKMGYEDLGIIRPDLILFLDVPPQTSRKLNLSKTSREYLKKKKRDIHEKDSRHQQSAYREYLRHIKLYDYWKRIPCCQRGRILSPEKIHQKIWKAIKFPKHPSTV